MFQVNILTVVVNKLLTKANYSNHILNCVDAYGCCVYNNLWHYLQTFLLTELESGYQTTHYSANEGRPPSIFHTHYTCSFTACMRRKTKKKTTS